jgi:hypothetical protein
MPTLNKFRFVHETYEHVRRVKYYVFILWPALKADNLSAICEPIA